ncbi:MAG: hypothetical protein U1F43_35810 [Myxococcota bacterium]
MTFTREGLRIGSAGFNLVVSRPASGSYAAPTTVGDARLVDDVAVVPPESLRRVLAAAAHADDLGAVLAALGSRGAPDDPATREVRLRLYWGDDYVGLVASTPALGLELSLSTGAFRAAIERNLARLGALGERILAIVRDPVAGFRGGSWLERSGITVAAGGLMVLALRRPGLVQRLELPLPERLAAVLDALGRGATPLQVLDLLVPEVARIEVGGATLTLGAHDDPTADWIPDGETWTLPRLPPWVSDRVGTPSGGQAQLAHRGNDRGLEVRARVTWEGGRSAELALNVQRVLTAVREQLPPEARAGLDTVLAELGLDVASGAQPTPGPAHGPAPGDAHQAGPVAPSAKEGGAAPAGRALHAELAAGILHVSVSGEPGIDAHWDLHQLFEEGDASALVPIDFALTGPGLRLAWDGTGLAASAAPPATARALVERDVEASELVRRVLRVPARELVHVAVVVDGEGEAQRAGVHVRHPNTGPATAQIYAEVAFRAAARALAERASQTTSLAITLGVDAALSERLDGLGVVAEVAGADAGRGGDGRPLRLELGYTAAHLVEAAFGRPAALLEPDHRRVDVMGFVSAGLEADGGEAPASWDGMARLGASSEALPAAALAPARRLFQLAGDGPLSLTMTAYFGGGGLGLRLGPAPSAGQRPQALRVKVDAARLGSELEALLAGMGPLGESLLARLGLREGWVQTLAASFDSHGVLRFAPRGGGSDGRGFALDLHGEVQSLLQLFEVGTGDVGAWLRTLLPSFDLALPDLPRVTLTNGLPSWLESWYERPAPRLRLDALPERIRALADRLGVDDLVPIVRVNRTATGVLQVAFGVQLGGRSLVFSGDFGAPLERMWSRIQGARAVAERVAQSLRELRRDGGARPAATTPAAATPTSPAGATPEPATRVAPSAKATRDDAAKDLGATVAALTENLDVSMDEGGVARLSVGPNGSILKVGFDLTRVMEGLALADLEPVELEIGALGLQVQTRAGPEPLPAGAVEVARPSEAELMFSGTPPAVTIPELVRQHLRIEATRASVQAFRSAVPGGDTSAAHDALGLYFQVPVMTSSQSPPADSAARLLLDLAPLLPRMQARIPQWLSSRVAATGWSIGLTTERRENTVTLELRRAASAPGANDDLLLRLGYTPQHAVDALSDATVLLVPDHVVAVRGMPDAAHPLADFHPMLDGIPAAGFPDAQQAWVAIGERGGVLRFVDYAAAADGSTVFAATTAGRPLFDLPVAMLWRLLLRVVSFVAPERAAQLGSAGAWLYRNGLLRIPVGVGRFLDFEPAPLFRALRSGDVTSLRPSGFHLGGDGLQVRLAERRPGDPPLEHFAERLVDADLGDIPSEVRELLGIPASVAGTKVVISGDPAVRQLAVAIIPPEPPQNANPPLPPRREIFVRLDLEVLKRRVMSLWQTLSGITGAVGSAAARIRAWLANLTWDRGGGERPARGAASGGSWSWLLGKLRIRFPRLWDGPEDEQDQEEEESTEISFDFLGALARLLRSGAAFLASLVPDSFRFPSPFGRIRWRLSDLLPRRPRSVRPPAERGRRWRLPAVGAWLRGLIERLDLDLHLPSLGDGPDRPRLPRPRLPDVELPDLETYCEIETRWDEASHTAGMTAYVRLLGGQEHALDFDFRVPRILERLRRLGGGARDLVRRLLDKLRRRPGPNEPPEAAGRRAGGVTGTLTEDGILILREAWFEPPQTRPMRIGFDLKRLLDGVDALDLVPYELDMPGDHVDIALGAATRPDGMPAAAERDRRPLAVAPPPGGAGFTLAAPAACARPSARPPARACRWCWRLSASRRRRRATHRRPLPRRLRPVRATTCARRGSCSTRSARPRATGARCAPTSASAIA